MDEFLTIEQIDEMVDDDVWYWLSNRFMAPDLIAEKVRFWVTMVANFVRDEATEKMRQEWDAALVAAWDEGYERAALDRYEALFDPGGKSLNPYRTRADQ